METKTRKYEALIITDGGSAATGPTVFEKLAEKSGAKVEGRNELGKRLLGYEVKKNTREGIVTSYDFNLDPSKVEALRKSLELSQEILRFMITLKAVPKPVKIKKQSPRPKRAPVGARK